MAVRIQNSKHEHRWKMVRKSRCEKCDGKVWRKKYKCRDCPAVKNEFKHCEHSL